MTRVTPIFVLSLPRSGSTLLQRAIAAHPQIATASEPWLLLPLLLGFREGHVLASYRQRYLATAFEDFLAAMADGQEVHRQAIRDFALAHYEAACDPGTSHFVDKTPRYGAIRSRWRPPASSRGKGAAFGSIVIDSTWRSASRPWWKRAEFMATAC